MTVETGSKNFNILRRAAVFDRRNAACGFIQRRFVAIRSSPMAAKNRRRRLYRHRRVDAFREIIKGGFLSLTERFNYASDFFISSFGQINNRNSPHSAIVSLHLSTFSSIIAKAAVFIGWIPPVNIFIKPSNPGLCPTSIADSTVSSISEITSKSLDELAS